MWRSLNASQGGQQSLDRLECICICCEERLMTWGVSCLERRLRGNLMAPYSLLRSRSGDGGAELSSLMPSARMCGNGSKLHLSGEIWPWHEEIALGRLRPPGTLGLSVHLEGIASPLQTSKQQFQTVHVKAAWAITSFACRPNQPQKDPVSHTRAADLIIIWTHELAASFPSPVRSF